MRLSCPNCLSEYDVPDAALAKPARRLRCGQCGHQWQAAWPEDTAPAATVVIAEAAAPVVPEAELPPQAERLFGKPVDEEAQAEIQRAAEAELLAHPEPALAGGVALQAEGPDDAGANEVEGLPLSGTFPAAAEEPSNGFTDLMYAARKKSLALEAADEPEEELPDATVKKSRTPVVVLLVIVLLVAVVFAAHGWIGRHVPGAAAFFHGLGLKN